MSNECITECEKVFSLSEEAIKMLEDKSLKLDKSCSEIINDLVHIMFFPLLDKISKLE